MRALITNDDGIESIGIRALAGAALEAGLEVVVAAPSWDSSGSSASLTAVQEDGRFVAERQAMPGLEGAVAYAVEGAPAFITTVAMSGAFGARPELVLSGINHGPNTGHSVLHSGTVGAALTALTYGVPSAAFSLDGDRSEHFDTAAVVAGHVLDWLVDNPGPVVLNVNVPDVELGELRGIEPARLCRFGAVQTNVTERGRGYVHVEWRTVDEIPEDGTDAAWLAEGSATVTALRAVCESELVDLSVLRRAAVGSGT